MTSDVQIQAFLTKAEQSLAGAASEFTNGRYDNSVNRCYYACFQAAIAALLHAGIRPTDPRAGWAHAFVQAQFHGQLLNRRKLYPAELRNALVRLLALRRTADYEPDQVTATEAARALRRAREFVATIRGGGGERR